jgi:hypothetical protein
VGLRLLGNILLIYRTKISTIYKKKNTETRGEFTTGSRTFDWQGVESWVGAEKHRHLFHSKNICPSFSLLQGKLLPFSPSPLRLTIFRLFVILSLTQLYLYTPDIFLFSTATFKYSNRAPLRQIGRRIVSERGLLNISVNETDTATSGLRWIFHIHSEFSRPAMCSNST